MINRDKKQIKDFIFKILPFAVYTVLIIIMHRKMVAFGDDAYFAIALQNNNLFNWIIERYNNWSSRIFIETIMVIILNMGFKVWVVSDIAVFLIIPYVIRKIFNEKNDTKIDWLICMVSFCIPINCYNSAGWVSTLLNYLWPLAFGLLLCIPIKKNFNNEKISIIENIIFIISIVISANQELMAGILAILYTAILCYNIIKRKRNNYIILYTILIALSIIFITCCPGNYVRNTSEIQTWFPNYIMFNFIDKIQLAIISMMKYISIDGRIISILMSIIIVYGVFVTNKSKFCRSIAIIQLLGNVPLRFVSKVIPNNIITNKIDIFSSTDLVINPFSYDNLMIYLIFSYYIIILGCIGISIYSIFKNSNKSVIALSIFSLGLISRLVMGISPTVYASAERTSLFLYGAFAILIVYILKDLKEQGKNINIMYYGTIFASIISYIHYYI